MIRFNSKFIYYFVYHYLSFDKNKTHSISLKKNVDDYSEQFLKGFILGLMITDGYLKKRFYFNTTSERLANNVLLILKKFNFEGHKYTHNRTKFGWKNLHMISLKKINSQNALKFLNKILKEAEYEEEFFFLKGYNGPVEI
ncbi:MAG: LAGLIDADG family homing endonuclease [Nanoarchaeota archaeon]|nr:LAGLIDADG family homing endonuclease [Nanoarchaeota archaeon]MBU1030949.1 LAGLIDADG family homing endonuclease [Nanoarchaeota archaeon]MBU1849697.1 LAGLIDADG family homing endonuclease [Nanoarchaeota archaeon]